MAFHGTYSISENKPNCRLSTFQPESRTLDNRRPFVARFGYEEATTLSRVSSSLANTSCQADQSCNKMSLTSRVNVDVLLYLFKFLDSSDHFNLVLSGVLQGFENVIHSQR
jgi:hypothetical protein